MIHKYHMNGLYIVIDVNSGAVHVVDNIVYDILNYYKDKNLDEIKGNLKSKYSVSEILGGYDEIKSLEENGILYSADEYEEIIPQVGNRNPVVKALCLLIAHDCNLKCGYCFAGEGEYHAQGKRSMMSLETGKKAIDFLIKNSAKRKNLEVDFFGGEPLMNMNVVKGIVEYARGREAESGKNFRFTITTNGVLLNKENIDYINENMQNIVLSLDGRKEVNDRMRKSKGNASTYDLILPKFREVAESRNQTNYYVRGTFTRFNKDFASDVLHIADLGFKQLSVEPVVGDKAFAYTFKEDDLPEIYQEYEKLAKEMLERRKRGEDFNFFHFMIDLTGGPCVAKRMSGCGAGSEYLAVTSDGDLYPCHQFTGLDGFKMGNLEEGVVFKDLRKEFEKCNIYTKDDCKSCWAKFYCSGGCAANAHTENGSIQKPYEIGCKLQRKRTECAIMLKAFEGSAF